MAITDYCVGQKIRIRKCPERIVKPTQKVSVRAEQDDLAIRCFSKCFPYPAAGIADLVCDVCTELDFGHGFVQKAENVSAGQIADRNNYEAFSPDWQRFMQLARYGAVAHQSKVDVRGKRQTIQWQGVNRRQTGFHLVVSLP